MKYIQNTLQNIFQDEVVYTTESNGYFYIYNYRLSKSSFLILTLKLSEEQFILDLLMLPTEMRKRGIGRRIVNELKWWAYQNDYKKINLLAIQNSKNFWEHQGFRIHNTSSLQMIYYI